uniref:Uncharacterized protein n=1 Tax=viral metagenome TaxID=1070528 RepID=A0A6C0EYM0_9ZZZZ
MAQQTELERVETLLYEKGITMELVEHHEGKDALYTYNAYITKKGKKILVGKIKLVEVKKNISMRGNNVWSNRAYPTKSLKAIFVNWIDTEGYEGNGYGKLILAYGVLSMHKKFPRIKYAALDDDSDACRSRDRNLYSKFGYCFMDPVVQRGPNNWEHPDPGKQVLMTDFIAATRREFSMEPREGRSEGRSEGRAEARPSRSSSKGKGAEHKKSNKTNKKSNKGPKNKNS